MRAGHTPAEHAVDTARGLLIARVDAMLSDIEAIVLEIAGGEVPDAAVRSALAIRVVQALQVRLFPEEFADGGVEPDPAGRLRVPAVGLIPKVFTQAAEYARWLERGRASPAAALTGPDGRRLFSDAELARLGGRIERRA